MLSDIGLSTVNNRMCRFLLHHPINSEYLEDSYYSECLTTCNVDKLPSSLTVIGQLLEFLSVAHPMFVTRQKWHVIRETLHWTHPVRSGWNRDRERKTSIPFLGRPRSVGRSSLSDLCALLVPLTWDSNARTPQKKANALSLKTGLVPQKT